MIKKIFANKTLGFVVILLLTILVVSAAETQFVRAATYIITASADAHSTISPSGNYPVTNGTSQSFTFTANTGYTISRVLVNGTAVNTTSPYTFTNIQANYAISVSTSINTYQINSSADAHSTITPLGSTSRNYGSSQTYQYSANTGYVITSVLVDNVSVPINGSYPFNNIAANHNITVKASIANFTITASNDTHSTINPSGDVQVSYGNSQTFTYSANTDYTVSSVLVNGSSTSIIGNYTFTNVKANYVIAINTVSSASSPTPLPSPTPTISPSTTPQPTVTPTPTQTPTDSPTPTPTLTPTSQPTAQPTAQPTQTTQQTNPTPQPTTAPPPAPTPTLTPQPTAKPTTITKTPTPTAILQPNTISQSQIFPAGALAAAIIAVTVGATIVLKRRQQPDESLEDF